MAIQVSAVTIQQATAARQGLLNMANNFAGFQQAGFTQAQARILCDLASQAHMLAVAVQNIITDLQRP